MLASKFENLLQTEGHKTAEYGLLCFVVEQCPHASSAFKGKLTTVCWTNFWSSQREWFWWSGISLSWRSLEHPLGKLFPRGISEQQSLWFWLSLTTEQNLAQLTVSWHDTASFSLHGIWCRSPGCLFCLFQGIGRLPCHGKRRDMYSGLFTIERHNPSIKFLNLTFKKKKINYYA